jgi:hypothetical protein
MLHKTRDLLVRQRTGLIDALRAHLAGYGIISGKGPGGVSSQHGSVSRRGRTARAARRSSAASASRVTAIYAAFS